MRLRVIMDSGKEYIVNRHYDDFLGMCFQGPTLPGGATIRNLRQTFLFTDNEEKKCLFNPTHVSSIEILED